MRWLLALIVVTAWSPPAAGQTNHLELKWMRDSEEYRALFLQTYRAAGEQVTRQVGALPRNTVWVVALDLDETVLDNIFYQFERAAYALPFDTASWNAWVRRAEAPALPGVVDFIALVRRLGGRVAWISNRDDVTAAETRANMVALGLWNDHDRLCLQINREHTKRQRRTELRTGEGACGWAGQPARVLAHLGDNIHDMPEAGEEAGEYGVNFFLLPNPSYGSWERAVTRKQN
jgi:5'-nucleotidase (lipoprotein e(P4) family)